jgi:hypothetical protein
LKRLSLSSPKDISSAIMLRISESLTVVFGDSLMVRL